MKTINWVIAVKRRKTNILKVAVPYLQSSGITEHTVKKTNMNIRSALNLVSKVKPFHYIHLIVNTLTVDESIYKMLDT